MTRGSTLLAIGISYVINPLILPPLLFAIVLNWTGATPAEVRRAASVVFVLMTALPLAALFWMIKSGRAATVHAVGRRERNGLFGLGLGCAVLAVIGVRVLIPSSSNIVLAVGACVLAVAALLTLLNRWLKVSIHTAAITGFVTILVVLPAILPDPTHEMSGMWLVPLIPVVMWARLRTRSHSTSEVLAGGLVGVVGPVVILMILSVLGTI